MRRISHRIDLAAALSLVVFAAAGAPPAIAASAAAKADAACAAVDAQIRTATPLASCRAANGDVTLGSGACTAAYVDRSYTGADALGQVTIGAGGTLYLPDANLDVEVRAINVVGAGANRAVLQAGTAACPIGTLDPANRVTLTFLGARPGAAATDEHAAHAGFKAHDHKSGDDCTTIDKGIGVGAGGVLRLYGARGVPPRGVSWTHLAQPAGPEAYQGALAANPSARDPEGIAAPVAPGGELLLRVALDVTAGPNPWRPGDWIVVGGTGFSPFESEFVRIDHVAKDASGVRVVLDPATPLRHYHFGGPDPGLAFDPALGPGKPAASFRADAAHNYGVDERAEVGLVTRNLRLSASTPTNLPPGDPAAHWGGELRFCKGYAEVGVQGVELEKFGKETLGSYPIHFHKANESAWQPPAKPAPPSGTHLVDANSIHHSYNKCAVLHSTSDVKLTNNVCAWITGHVFYQEIGDEFDAVFDHNLGLGTMLNGFGLAPDLPRVDGLVKGWWEGDYLGRAIGFDGLAIANTDAPSNPVIGQCYASSPTIGLIDAKPTGGAACPPGKLLYEPPTGFWIVNPSAQLEGNSIGGCQSLGKGYWYLPPAQSATDPRYALKFQPVGRFVNNRVHSCYDGIFGENDGGVITEQLQPKVGGDNIARNLIARFDGFTASRIRNRGVWMRPLWFVFDNARVASSREDVSLVTSGGLDGNGPGAWGLLSNSVVVGWSRNNVDRWGPCANLTDQEGRGCVDRNVQSNDLYEKGYPSPAWNFAGFYIYDGPVRIHDTRFVNFRADPSALLTAADAQHLRDFKSFYGQAKVYEGDAALGWFQNNQSAYPTATEVRGLVFEGTDLRHQVFTDNVNFGRFDDGDKNTAVIDRDGSLTGFRVLDPAGQPAVRRSPISLNNLPFNAVSNAVDECLATGRQDAALEGRPTSLISPGDMATLEFGALTLPDGTIGNTTEPKMTQYMTFTQDMRDLFGVHPSMTLHSRNNQGLWEPKIASGRGYTVHAAQAPSEFPAGPPGIPRYINVGLTDAVKPDIEARPFHARLGVCYTNKDGTHPPARFEVRRGYRSWGGNGAEPNDPALQKYFNKLVLTYRGQTCHNLDYQQNALRTPGQDNTDPVKGCPADGVTPLDSAEACRARGGVPGKRDPNGVDDLCVYEKELLTPAAAIDELAYPGANPSDLAPLFKYYYDATTGMLFFHVVQDAPNAEGPSPLGSCKGAPGDDPACPDPHHPMFPESYYGCPPQGCVTYTVRMAADVAYDPGASACGDPADPARFADPAAIYRYAKNGDGEGRYELPRPVPDYVLAYVPSPSSPHPDVRDGKTVTPVPEPGTNGFVHVAATFPPVCSGTPQAVTGGNPGARGPQP